LPDNLIERGLDRQLGYLFIIDFIVDGSEALRKTLPWEEPGLSTMLWPIETRCAMRYAQVGSRRDTSWRSSSTIGTPRPVGHPSSPWR
jgi:hypothetical protein